MRRGAWTVAAVAVMLLADHRGSLASPPAGRFMIGAQTVIDTVTGLEWLRFPSGGYIFDDGLYYCENLTTGGKTDWRLANLKEVSTLIDDRGPLDAVAFPLVNPYVYTANFSDNQNQHPIAVSLNDGVVFPRLEQYNGTLRTLGVMCVRGE